MRTSDDLYALADLVATLENAGYGVEELDPGTVDSEQGGSAATLVVECPALARPDDDLELVPRSATVTDSGAIGLELEVQIGEHAGPGDGTDAGAGAVADDGGNPGPGEIGADRDDQKGDHRTSGTATDDTDPGMATDDTDPGTATDVDPTDVEPDDGEQASNGDDATDGDDDATDDGDPVDSEGATVGDDSEDATVGDEDGSADDDFPPHRDPDRLAAVYDENLTFAEMRDALGADVTPQTVRKHMISHGIHEPDSHALSRGSDTGAGDDADGAERESPGESASEGGSGADPETDPHTDEDARDGEDDGVDGEEPATTTGDSADDGSRNVDAEPILDGIGMAEHLTTERVVEAVLDGRTLYEVKRSLDLDRADARQLLDELNLLDLVHARLDAGPTGEVTREDVEERIESATVQ